MIGRTLGHYRIDSQLGAGGMGVVYRARDTRLERTVAIKLVGERLSEDPTARDRLLREARTASALNHPHICTVHEVGEADGHVYIVMEHVEGKSLSNLLSESRPMETVVRYGIQIADALAHAHDHGIVHRDLKTGNVIVTPEGRVKVLDFGLAKRLAVEDLSEQETRTSDSLTQAGQVVGTLHYLAPEMLRGQPADARTDIWALGVLLYELLTGNLPFGGSTRFEVTHAILGEAPVPMPASVPVSLRAVIQRCLVKEPGQRYQRASEVRAVLEAIQSGSGVPFEVGRRPRVPRWVMWAALGAAGLLAAYGAYRWRPGSARGIDSMAVLPFVNQGGDPENEYLSDGIAESVIGSLSRLPKLKMIAFGSVLHYKGRPVDAALVARELGVAAMVVGRVAPHSGGVQISAELIDTRDGSRIWGDQYEAKPGAFLSVQQEISRQISEELRLHLSGEEQGRVTKRFAGNAEAYELYLKGRHHYNKFTPESYEKSLEYYRRAMAKDPGYAPAYTGLAGTYIAMTTEGLLPPGEAYDRAQEAVAKALELDPTEAEAHLRLGHLRWFRDWDWEGAESEFEQALALDPENHFLSRRYSQYLRAMGRWDEAFAQIRRAQEGDPLSVETNEGAAATYYWAGRLEEATTQLQKALEIEPNRVSTHDLLADVYARRGLHTEAIAEVRRTFELSGDEESGQAIEQDFRKNGYERVVRGLNQATLDHLRERAQEGYVSPFSFAVLHAKLGERDQAFAWLEKAFAERSPWLVFLKVDPDLENLRSDPRFTDLARRIGLP